MHRVLQAGVRNGMMMGKALTHCPDLTALPYDFEGYSEVSTTLYETVARCVCLSCGVVVAWGLGHGITLLSILHMDSLGLGFRISSKRDMIWAHS